MNGMRSYRRRLMTGAYPKELPNYLCFTALEDGTFTLRIGQQIGTVFYQYIEYSVDECETWNRTDNADNTEITVTTPTITTGNKVYWRGSGTYISNYFIVARYSNFSSTGKFDASGNIASLCGLKNFKNCIQEKSMLRSTKRFASKCSQLLHNYPKLEPTQLFFRGRMD